MTDLLTKLQEAGEGSRELDKEVAKELGAVIRITHMSAPRYQVLWPIGSEPFYEIDPDDLPDLPAYTTSIDAALTLMKEVLPGWSIHLEMDFDREVIDPETDLDPCACSLFKHEDGRMRHIMEWAKSPAIAICIALIKAQKENGDA